MAALSKEECKSFLEQAEYRASLAELESQAVEQFLGTVAESPEMSELFRQRVEGLRKRIEFLQKHYVEIILDAHQLQKEI
jgi:hypothetical protein